MTIQDPPARNDPLDSLSEPGLHWSRSNIGEAMPGVQTPLSWTVWAGGNERALREAAYAIGALTRHERAVPPEINQRLLRVFRGRPALNVEFMTRIGDRMPGTSGPQAAISLLGRAGEGIDYRPTRRRYPIIAWRFPATFLRTPRRLRSFARDTDTWYRQRISRVDTLDEAAARTLFGEAVDRFTEAIEIQTVSVLAVIQPLYEALQQLVTRAGVGDVAVLSGSGGAEMQVVGDIWLAAHDRLLFDRVVATHGFHGPAEGELSSRVWREDPAPLRKLLDRYADRPDPAGATRDLAAMQREVLARLPAHMRPVAGGILRLSQDRIQLRGVVKRSFLQCFDVTRAAARHLGHHLAEAGTLADPDDVFHLTVTELRHGLPADARDVVVYRRELRAGHRHVDIPGSWTGQPTATPITPQAVGDAQQRSVKEVTGIGVSAGIAEGTVRVLLEPDFDDIADDEILVAPTTDPSWSSVLYLSAGLVVDIGGALSHAALVAREMGIPCVVNTRTGTRDLRTGDHVRIDGTTGTVTILERAGDQRA